MWKNCQHAVRDVTRRGAGGINPGVGRKTRNCSATVCRPLLHLSRAPTGCALRGPSRTSGHTGVWEKKKVWEYLHKVNLVYEPVRYLWSCPLVSLLQRTSTKKHFVGRASQIAACVLWNVVPAALRHAESAAAVFWTLSYLSSKPSIVNSSGAALSFLFSLCPPFCFLLLRWKMCLYLCPVVLVILLFLCVQRASLWWLPACYIIIIIIGSALTIHAIVPCHTRVLRDINLIPDNGFMSYDGPVCTGAIFWQRSQRSAATRRRSHVKVLKMFSCTDDKQFTVSSLHSIQAVTCLLEVRDLDGRTRIVFM